MTNTAATVDRDPIAIDDALIALNHDLNAVVTDHPVIATHRDAMLAGVRGAVMHLHYGRIERAASIIDCIRDDMARLGF
jgi:hypothetical protein